MVVDARSIAVTLGQPHGCPIFVVAKLLTSGVLQNLISSASPKSAPDSDSESFEFEI